MIAKKTTKNKYVNTTIITLYSGQQPINHSPAIKDPDPASSICIINANSNNTLSSKLCIDIRNSPALKYLKRRCIGVKYIQKKVMS